MADRVLILGGTGFIGRNLVKFLVDNEAAERIRVADKVPPAMAFLSPEHQAAFGNKCVEFVQANLSNAASIAKAFAIEGGFNIVINLAAETKYGQSEQVYQQNVFDISVKCAQEAAKLPHLEKFIELSTAQVYAAGKKPSDEKAKIEPWTHIATMKSKVETELNKIKGLPLIVLRPAIVYGPGDVYGLTPRIICGAVYKKLGEKMEFLWSADLRINTVHVRDVCKAIWHVAKVAKPGAVYNLADSGDTTQGKFNKIIEQIFGIQTGFVGTALSTLAKTSMSSVTEETNEKHLLPWSELCKEHGVTNTPLTPYLDQELLYNNSLSVEGSAIKATGFEYDVPEPNLDNIKEVVKGYVAQKLFPKVVEC